MFDYLPTDGMAILGYVTTVLCLGLAVIIDGVIRVVERNTSEGDTMPILAAQPYKPLHIEV